jgi:hypothetical protein
MNDLRDKIAAIINEFGAIYWLADAEAAADRILAIPEIRDALATHADIVMIPTMGKAVMGSWDKPDGWLKKP